MPGELLAVATLVEVARHVLQLGGRQGDVLPGLAQGAKARARPDGVVLVEEQRVGEQPALVHHRADAAQPRQLEGHPVAEEGAVEGQEQVGGEGIELPGQRANREGAAREVLPKGKGLLAAQVLEGRLAVVGDERSPAPLADGMAVEARVEELRVTQAREPRRNLLPIVGGQAPPDHLGVCAQHGEHLSACILAPAASLVGAGGVGPVDVTGLEGAVTADEANLGSPVTQGVRDRAFPEGVQVPVPGVRGVNQDFHGSCLSQWRVGIRSDAPLIPDNLLYPLPSGG
ncbi:hypothetical protein D3C86_1268510 [compost metagenome]